MPAIRRFDGVAVSHVPPPTSGNRTQLAYGRLRMQFPRSLSDGPLGQSHHVNLAVRMIGPTTVSGEMNEHTPAQ